MNIALYLSEVVYNKKYFKYRNKWKEVSWKEIFKVHSNPKHSTILWQISHMVQGVHRPLQTKLSVAELYSEVDFTYIQII